MAQTRTREEILAEAEATIVNPRPRDLQTRQQAVPKSPHATTLMRVAVFFNSTFLFSVNWATKRSRLDAAFAQRLAGDKENPSHVRRLRMGRSLRRALPDGALGLSRVVETRVAQFTPYSLVTLNTSLSAVKPAKALSTPSWNIVTIPAASASSSTTVSEARSATTAFLRSGVMTSTSKIPIWPL